MKQKLKFKKTEIGMIPEDWKIEKLKELCIKITDGSHFSPKTKPEGKLIATVKDMNEYGFNYETCRRISEQDFNQLVRQDCKPKINDVLIAKDGSYLKHVFVTTKDEEIIILSSIAIIRPNVEKITPHFLKYLFSDPITKERVKGNYVSGAVIPRIVLKDFAKIDLPVPSIQEQTSISKILSNLDSKIELNQQMNKTLEAIGQALFRHWFVDFEFPNEKGKPYKSSGGEMINSELGEIPKGWKVGKLGDLGKIQPGFAFKSKDFLDEGIGLAKIKNIQPPIVDFNFESYISEELYNETNNRFYLFSGDILIAMTGAKIGKVGIIPKTENKILLNQRVGKVESKNKYLMYLILNTVEIQGLISGGSSASSAQGNISNSDIENFN